MSGLFDSGFWKNRRRKMQKQQIRMAFRIKHAMLLQFPLERSLHEKTIPNEVEKPPPVSLLVVSVESK